MDFPQEVVETYEDRLRGEIPDAWILESFDNEMQARHFVDYCLSTVYNDGGITRWWNKRNQTLEGRRPMDVWEPEPQRVIDAAARLATL